MIIAHIPTGYIFTHYIKKGFSINASASLGVAASILPDIDMLYFYLFDNRQHHHHTYSTHIPFFWLIIAVAAIAIGLVMRNRVCMGMCVLFFSNIFLHLVLDTIAGDILWLYPFSNVMCSVFTIPVKFSHWVLNFILHPTFILEIVMIFGAMYLYKRKRRETCSE